MSWIDVSWMVMVSACLTLSSIHLLVWSNQRSDHAHLAFSLAGLSVATVGVFELLLMHAKSPEQYGVLLRWAHVAFVCVIPCLVAFVRLHLHAGRAWLGHLAWGMRALTLVPNFATGVNLNFIEIDSLLARGTWGDAVYMAPLGTVNPWMILGQASSYVLLAFFVDAALTVQREARSDHRAKSARICWSMALFSIAAAIWQVLVVAGSLHLPISVLPAFTGVLLVMSYELGGDIIRASQLAADLNLTQTTLRKSEQRIEDAVIAAGFGLWEWDVTNDRMWMSSRANELLGLPDDQPFDMEQYNRRVDADDREWVAAAMAALLVDGGPFLIQYRIVHDDGRRRWILSRGHCDITAKPPSVRVRGVLVDITERKLVDEQFRAVVESAPTGMLVTDPDGGIKFANRRAERDFGWARDELEGMPITRLVPELEVRATGSSASAFHDLSGLRRDGGRFPIDVVLSHIELEGTSAVLVLATDIGERRRMELEAATQRDELAHLSRVAMIAELSGSLAHELNQPLTSILSRAQAALRFLDHDPVDLAEIRDGLVHIVESDKRAGEVIRRLRAMLRKEPPEFRELDLNETVLDVLRIVRSDLLNKSVKIRLELQEDLPASDGDRVQLQQVLLNLIVNASDAMHSQAVDQERELTVITRRGEDGGAMLTVRDRGRGIAPEDLERIFLPFVTSKQDGMGLGLAVCRTIIESHRGRLWASNNDDGSGASLHFWLPDPAVRTPAMQ